MYHDLDHRNGGTRSRFRSLTGKPAPFVTDYSARTSKETREYLTAMAERFVFLFAPKHGSWLNLVEGFFSKLTRQMLREIRVAHKEELIERLYKYFEEINDSPIVYHWKYHMNEIDPEEAIGLAN